VENDYASIQIKIKDLLENSHFHSKEKAIVWPYEKICFVYQKGLLCQLKITKVNTKNQNKNKIKIEGNMKEIGLGPKVWWN
jgi:DNA-directed RNA polymerase subunit E'/Rpb7